MERLVLLSTGCPRCRMLETRLKREGFSFDVVDDEEKIREMGFMEVPILQCDDRFMNFKEAIDWMSGEGR